jgi:hypothetical protein
MCSSRERVDVPTRAGTKALEKHGRTAKNVARSIDIRKEQLLFVILYLLNWAGSVPFKLQEKYFLIVAFKVGGESHQSESSSCCLPKVFTRRLLDSTWK